MTDALAGTIFQFTATVRFCPVDGVYLKSTAYHWMLGLVAALGPTDTHVKYPHCPSPPLIEGSLGVYALLGGPQAGPKSGVSRLWVMVGQAYLG